MLCILSLTPLLWFHGSQVILGHDSGFRLNFVDHIHNLFYGWNPYVNFGVDWSLYHGFILIQGIESVFSYIFSSVSLGERLTFVYWFFSIGFSMYLFLRYFFPGKKFRPLRMVGPVFFMYNFYILNAWTIAERAKFSLYIALPLMIVIFFRTVLKEWSALKGAALFGLLFFFYNGGGSPPLYGGILVTFGLLVIYFLFSDFRGNIARLISISILFGISFCLFNAYWIIPQYGLIRDSYAGAVSSRGGIEGLIAWEKEISKYASIPNLLRLQGFPDWYGNADHPYASFYISNLLLRFASFIPIVTVIFGLFWIRFREADKRQRQILQFLLLLGIVGLFFSSGSHMPIGIVYVYLMRHLPGFAVFRSSFYKFAPTYYLAVIVFFGYYLSEFFEHRKTSRVTLTVAAFIISIGVVMYHFPYLTGNFFALKSGFSTRVSIPAYVEDMGAYMKNNTKPADRIMLLPPLDVGYINSPIDTYTWGFYSLDVLPRIMLNRSFVANDGNDDYISRLLYKSLQAGNEEQFNNLAEKSGITHILWRGDVRLADHTGLLTPLSMWEQKIKNIKSLRLASGSGLWKLYTISRTVAGATIYAPLRIDTVERTSNDAYIVASYPSAQKTGLLRVSDMSERAGIGNFIGRKYIEGECYLCKSDEYKKLVEAITVPQAKRYNFPFLRDRQKKKDSKALDKAVNPGPQIDVRLSIMLSDISALLHQMGMSEGEKKLTVSEIHGHIKEIEYLLSQLSGREKDVYSNRVSAYFEAALRDIGSNEFGDIKNTLAVAKQSVSEWAWMSDHQILRFGITVPMTGMYSLYIPEPAKFDTHIRIDEVRHPTVGEISLSAGYHRMEVVFNNGQNERDEFISPIFLYTGGKEENIPVPGVTFSQVNATRYRVQISDAVSSYVLIFNQRYDPGWALSVGGVRQDYYHLEVNGFANAWVVPKAGTYTIELYYRPQQYMYVGVLVSAISLAAALIVLCVLRRRII